MPSWPTRIPRTPSPPPTGHWPTINLRPSSADAVDCCSKVIPRCIQPPNRTGGCARHVEPSCSAATPARTTSPAGTLGGARLLGRRGEHPLRVSPTKRARSATSTADVVRSVSKQRKRCDAATGARPVDSSAIVIADQECAPASGSTSALPRFRWGRGVAGVRSDIMRSWRSVRATTSACRLAASPRPDRRPVGVACKRHDKVPDVSGQQSLARERCSGPW